MSAELGSGLTAIRPWVPALRLPAGTVAGVLVVLGVLWIHGLVLEGLAQVLRPGTVGVVAADVIRPFTTRTIPVPVDLRPDAPAVALSPLALAALASPRPQAPPVPPLPLAPQRSGTAVSTSPNDAGAPTLAPGPTALASMPSQERTTSAPQEPLPVPAALPPPALDLGPGPSDTAGAAEVTPARTGSEQLYDYFFPGSTRLKYEISGRVKGFGYHVAGELLWVQDGKTYDARLEISHFLLGSRVQTSKGDLTPRGLEPLRFGDKVRSEVAAHFQRSKGLVSFSANTPDVPLMPLAQDQLSIFVQLAAMWGGNARRFSPGMPLPFQAIGPRSSENWIFVVGPSERLKVEDRELSAVRLVRERSGDFDTRVELWLAPALEYLPARIRLTQSNGDEVDMLWSRSEKP